MHNAHDFTIYIKRQKTKYIGPVECHLVVDVDGEEYEGVQADVDHQKEPEGRREASKQLSHWST